MKELFTSIITSSADPAKTSLAVKGALTAVAPIAIVVSGLSDGEYGTLVDTIAALVFWATSIPSAIMVVWGIVRKVKLGRWSASK